MSHAVIAATGLFTPDQSISNAELVAAYNAWAEQFNIDHAAEIAEGDVAELTPSSVEFIEKASGIKSRFVLSKAPILDPDIMAPRLPERPNDELSVLAEMGTIAARDALAEARMIGMFMTRARRACARRSGSVPPRPSPPPSAA